MPHQHRLSPSADGPGQPEPVSADALKRAMAHFASGVTVVTSRFEQVAHAMTANAFCSVSLDPPLVLVCVAKRARFHPAVLGAGRWAVSILADDQQHLARHFAISGRDLLTQFDRVGHTPAPFSGSPLLTGALAWMDCETQATHDAGDHTIVVGTVLWADEESSLRAPLTYYQGTYNDAY
ncbi:flavin reductase family protein [Microlunatus panaciterrae]|uniref:Flavin reductase (DIM6/NTAB) family NADH-FMN oxidoreductase RutF n=1 Tax=Microlunatus panaciterrae TaxID=400768 RepID=A0ABS2RHE0_9ACTN|nr:flavin reductase family protein [Microlunatus panaciterrae]MBM7797947.1 flavin reductase (DIM6/NTAB) family NADH-FMN oxidoreductase RutF [Microlunatus panaciterrae]